MKIDKDRMFDRAYGAVLGALVGDAAGAVLEFRKGPIDSEDVARAMKMPGGGPHRVAPGQITDDGELTIALLRGLAESPFDSTENAARAYVKWMQSNPFDVGGTTARALEVDPADVTHANGRLAAMISARAQRHSMKSEANGALMRSTPLALWGAFREPGYLVEAVKKDTAMTHPNPRCVSSSVAYVMAIRSLILTGDVSMSIGEASKYASDMASFHADDREVKQWLTLAREGYSVPFEPNQGHVKIGFTHAFQHLANRSSYEKAIRLTLMGGGDTDTNACIVGGLVGALHGASGIPKAMRDAVLKSDTEKGRPRPRWLHPSTVEGAVRRWFVR